MGDCVLTENMDCNVIEDCSEEYCDDSTIVAPQTLNQLIEELTKVFSHDRVNVEYVKALMNSYRSNREEWKKYAKFDRHRYTRNLVDEGNGKFNLMLLCWNESQGSSIHSHANSHCFMKVLDGKVQEELFAWPGDSSESTAMESLRVEQYQKNQTAYICDELGLHRVENPSHSNKAVSLHLYSPPFDECQCFDQNTGKVNTAKVTFWTKFGVRTPFKTSSNAVCEAENN